MEQVQDFNEIRIKAPKKTQHEIRHWTRDRDGWRFQKADQTLTRFKTRISIQTPEEAKALYYNLGFVQDATNPNSTVGRSMTGSNAQIAKAVKRIKKELKEEAAKQGVDVTEEEYNPNTRY